MTTERSSFDDQGVDAIVATREDELTGTGLDDQAPTSGAGYDTPSRNPSSASGSSGDRLGDAAGSLAERVADTAQQKVGTQVDGGLSRASEMLTQLAGAVRQSGDQLRGDQPQIAGFADTAAQQVDKVSDYLRQTDFQGLVREAEGFARRQPAAFLGGALALGLIASRFLKASPEGGSGSGAYRSGGYRSGLSAGYGSRGGYGTSGGYTGYAGRYGPSHGSGYGSGSALRGDPAGYGSTTRGGYGTGSTGLTGSTGTGVTGATGTGVTGATGTGVEHGGV